MTQRVFDIENEKDMQDLWNILREEVVEIKKQDYGSSLKYYGDNNNVISITDIIEVNWHDKTEITRPIQEATEADIGKLCYFWEKNFYHYGILTSIGSDSGKAYYVYDDSLHCNHCRRLTKQEIEELC